MAPLVDSHCHLNFPPLGPQLDEILQHARNEGVAYFLCVGVNLEDFPQVQSLAEAHGNIFASVGVHPNEQNGKEPSADELVALATNVRVVAIGETGLDYFRTRDGLEAQRERFRRHIRAAHTCRKPLIIHTREAAEDTLSILRDERAGEVGGVMHCFTEDWATAEAALDLGFYISFSGIVTYKNADALRAVAARVPSDRLLVETDAPYLAPVPHRGQTNRPGFVRHVAECLAQVRAVTPDEIARVTTANFFALFRDAQPVAAGTA